MKAELMGDGVAGVTRGAAALTPGTRLGGYEVRRLLGQGGMAEVHEGVHLALGKGVAIKTLRPAFMALPGANERFLREAQMTSRLRHPHIVDVTDVGVDAGRTFMVMELLDGEDLSARIARGPLGIEELIDMALPVASAVVAAHAQGIIHRDLKPQNIFLTRAPDVGVYPKVLDFGISKRAGAEAQAFTNPRGFWGSPSYFSPEQLDDAQTVTQATDQYALGVLLYEALTGQTPFPQTDLRSIVRAIVGGEYVAPKELRPELPTGLQTVIGRAMAVNPADRYATVKDFGQMLLVFASPATRLRWKDAFIDPVEPAGAAHTADKSSPVPVTEQTPATHTAPQSRTGFFNGSVRPDK